MTGVAFLASYHLFSLSRLRIRNVVLNVYAVATETLHAEPEDVHWLCLTDAVAAGHGLVLYCGVPVRAQEIYLAELL